MTPSDCFGRARDAWRQSVAEPDFGRAVRATIAVMVPWLATAFGWFPFDATFTAFAAQSVAGPKR